jgi:hypothetical protein
MLLLAATAQRRTEEVTAQMLSTALRTVDRKWPIRRGRNARRHRHDRCLLNPLRWGRTVTGTKWVARMHPVVTG